MAIAIRPAGTKQLAGTELMGHLFRRAGFGATREQLEAATAQGYEATVEQLLHPENAQPLEEDLIFRYYPDMKEAGQIDPAQSRWVYRMINTRRPLEEKMALFWHHLFATGFAKLNHAKVMTNQIALFRKHALGDFRTLLIEISRDPAMIFWLDNHTNTKRVHNENYGRELLETIWRRPSSQWSNAGSTAGPRRSVDRAERLRQDDSLQSDHRSDSPHEQRVLLRHTDISRLPTHHINQLGIGRTFQVTRLFGQMTALENMMVVGRQDDAANHARATDLLEFVQLQDASNEYAANLSYGQQKLLEFARLLMDDPSLILLDEPFAGINPTRTQRLQRRLQALVEQGKTLLVTAHEMKTMMAICSEIFVLDYGELIAHGAPEAHPDQRSGDGGVFWPLSKTPR